MRIPRTSLIAALAVAVAALAAAPAAVRPVQAQEEEDIRWWLEVDFEKPQRYVVGSDTDDSRVFWYQLYTVTNPHDRPVRFPLLVQIHSLDNVDVLRDPDKAFADGVADAIHPAAEREIIVHEARLHPRPGSNIGEQIRALKAEGRYLNALEIKATPLAPGETRQGLALFRKPHPGRRALIKAGVLTREQAYATVTETTDAGREIVRLEISDARVEELLRENELFTAFDSREVDPDFDALAITADGLVDPVLPRVTEVRKEKVTLVLVWKRTGDAYDPWRDSLKPLDMRPDLRRAMGLKWRDGHYWRFQDLD